MTGLSGKMTAEWGHTIVAVAVNSFTLLMNVLDERADIRNIAIEGEEIESHGQDWPSIGRHPPPVVWSGGDPDSDNLQAIVDDLISHLNLL